MLSVTEAVRKKLLCTGYDGIYWVQAVSKTEPGEPKNFDRARVHARYLKSNEPKLDLFNSLQIFGPEGAENFKNFRVSRKNLLFFGVWRENLAKFRSIQWFLTNLATKIVFVDIEKVE